MTSYERLRATIDKQKTDRIPVIPEVGGVTSRVIGKDVIDYVKSGRVIADSQIAAQEKFGYDAVIAFADLSVEAEAIGCELSFSKNNYPYVKKTVLLSGDDVSDLPVPTPLSSGRMPEIIKAVEIMKEHYKGRVPVVAHALAPLTIASRIMDIEKMLYLIVDEPEKFRNLLNYTRRVALRFIDALIWAGADCIIMFNPSASPAVLPEKIFREFELPNISRIFNHIKQKHPNIITWYSVAGAIQNIIPDLELVEIDIVTIDYLVTLGVAFDKSSTISFNGNIKPLLFTSKSSEEIQAISESLLFDSLGRGGFILGSGCEVPLNARLDNLKALVKSSFEVAKKFREYGTKGKGQKCVTFFPLQKRVYVKSGACLLDASSLADVTIPHLCYKSGTCGACVVQVLSGDTTAYTSKEELVLSKSEKERGLRLACQVNIISDTEVYTPKESWVKAECDVYKKDLLVDPIDSFFGLYPVNSGISVFAVSTDNQDKAKPRFERVIDVLGSGVNIPMEFLYKLSDKDGLASFSCIVSEQKNSVLDVTTEGKAYGVALDIGTTTIAAYIHDIRTGEFIKSCSALNPQRAFGDNVLTRAEQYIKGIKNRSRLQSQLFSGINKVILKATQDAGIDYKNIYKLVVVANSVMHHIFLRLALDDLVKAPFVPLVSSAYSFFQHHASAHKMIAVNNNALVSCPPLVGGFIGSDIVAGILASGLHCSDELVLLVDLGTNGEMVLGNKDRIIATSVSAGPAFENSHISSGKMAGSSAIYRVYIDENYKATYKTINAGKPSGFCGTAVIDVIASLLRLGVIDKRGHFVDVNIPNLLNDKYVVIPKQETAFFKPIIITLKDIEEVQKAKGAIMAGITLLLKEFGVSGEDVDRVILTGGFGMTIDVENAVRIGMLPKSMESKVEFVQNAAGIGARLCLLSKKAEESVKRISDTVKYINVAGFEEFNNAFIDSMFFKCL